MRREGRCARCLNYVGVELTRLRVAKSEDIELLLAWANDPGVVRSSFRGRTITEDEHELWFTGALHSDCVKIYIGISEHGVPFGQVRFEKVNKSAMVDISICVTSRGNGFGRTLLMMAMDAYKSVYEDITFVADVKLENLPSRRLFLSAGYTEYLGSSRSGVVTYKR